MELENLKSKNKSCEVVKAKGQLQGRWMLLLCEVLTLTPVILIIIGLYSIPTILYALPPPEAEVTDFNSLNHSACLQVETYTGEICSKTFTSLQTCFSGVTTPPSSLNIPSVIDQEAGERDASTLVNGLSFFNPSPQCREAIEPFICLSIFMLCDAEDRLHTITRKDCLEVRDNVCAELWSVAVETLGAGALPVCEDLSDITDVCRIGNSSALDLPTSNSTSPENNQDIADAKFCSDGFFFDVNVTNICRPICGEFNQALLFLQILYKLTVVVGIIAAMVVVILALTIQREKMFAVPLVFVVYICLSVFILCILVKIEILLLVATVTVGLFIKPRLFCGSRDWIVALEMMTPYCTITGLVLVYTNLHLNLWATQFSIFLFWGVAFPFSFVRLKNSRRICYAHIICVMVAVLLPLPAALIHLKDGFIETMSPPTTCYGVNTDYNFYTFVLPLSISSALATCLLVLTFWAIFKVFVVKKLLARKKVVNVGKGELKLAVLVVYSIIVSVVGLVVLVKAQLDRYGSTSSNFEDYLICESTGKSADCSLDTSTTNLLLISLILVSLVPVVALVFVCDLHAFKKKSRPRTHVRNCAPCDK